jgi:AAA domain, putative AbiEii toxin, Type IV TA system/AAA domain
MIHSLSIKNFKCFEHVVLKDFGTINVIVGDSGSGKTALLEAIYLAQGPSPELVLKFRLWRGLGQALLLTANRPSYESLWKDLFFNLDQKRLIEIDSDGSPENRQSLRIRYDQNDAITVPLGGAKTMSNGVNPAANLGEIIPISFEWRGPGRKDKHDERPQIGAEGLKLGGLGHKHGVCSFYSSSFAATTPPSEAAGQFSELSKIKMDGLVRTAYKDIYPALDNLSVEINAGSPMLYCEVPWAPEKVPVASVSAGAHKLLTILLGIATQSKGIVLIDELENGLYFNTLPKAWESILRFCEAFKTQVFVTTHSLECIKAVLPTLKSGNEKHFRLIRTERKNGQRKVAIFKGKQFEAAIATNVEIRGK